MPFFSNPTSGRGFFTFGPGVPRELSWIMGAGGGGSGRQQQLVYKERNKPWRDPPIWAIWGQPVACGGGGAGGYRSGRTGELSGRNSTSLGEISVTAGTNYFVRIGGGGNGGANVQNNGSQGGTSEFAGYSATGGGGGGFGCCSGGTNGSSGGCGGGAGGDVNFDTACEADREPWNYAVNGSCGSSIPGTGLSGQGFNGGGVAGGGAGAAGSGSTGGAGINSTISGSTVRRCNGGSWGTSAGPGTNTGNGGNAYWGSQSGSSGFVIIRFVGRMPNIDAGLTYSVATLGSETVISFTAGTGNISW